MSRINMKQKRVGIYFLGRTEVEVFVREGTGGEFFFSPEKGHLPRMKIGMGYKDWGDVVEVVVHEAMEFCLDEMRDRYDCSNDITQDHAAYLFVFRHNDLSEACSRVGQLIAGMLPDLTTVYRTWRKHNASKK